MHWWAADYWRQPWGLPCGFGRVRVRAIRTTRESAKKLPGMVLLTPIIPILWHSHTPREPGGTQYDEDDARRGNQCPRTPGILGASLGTGRRAVSLRRLPRTHQAANRGDGALHRCRRLSARCGRLCRDASSLPYVARCRACRRWRQRTEPVDGTPHRCPDEANREPPAAGRPAIA